MHTPDPFGIELTGAQIQMMKAMLQIRPDWQQAFDEDPQFATGLYLVVRAMSHALDDMVENATIESLDLTVRAYNCLIREGIKTVAQLCDRTVEDLLEIRNFGMRSIDEVQAKLATRGRHLKPMPAVQPSLEL